jgi:MFS family permease
MLFSIGLCLLAMVIMCIEGIWFFIIGRFFYGAGAAIFYSAGGRYVEECAPPKYVSILVVCYSCGISFSRAIVLVGVAILPDSSAPVEVLETTQTWRVFLLIPALFCLYCLVGLLFVIRYNTPTYLINKKRDDEALLMIKKMFNTKVTEPEQIFNYLSRNTSSSTDNLSYSEACCTFKYRKTLFMLLSISFCLQINGMYTIGSYGAVVYETLYEESHLD